MRLLLVFTMMLLAACQSPPPLPAWQSSEGMGHPDLGQIIDLRSGDQISAQELVNELAGADRVLVGERHDNPDHHALQRWLLEALAQRREQRSLLLEMLNPDQQEKVARAQASIERGQWPTDLPAALGWQKGWDWELYAPLVEYALAQPYPVQKTLLEQIRVSHCKMLPEAQLPAMLAVQQQRDRRMAERLEAALKPAMLLAGAFHLRRDLGVPLHLTEQGSTRVLLLAEVGEVVQAEQADFVWFTPVQPQQDHCAGFRERAE